MGNNVLFNFNVIGAFNISNIPWYLTSWNNFRINISVFFKK